MNTERKVTPYDGRKALIIGDHPHKDEIAVCLGAEITLLGWGLVFESETQNMGSFFVFDPKNVKWL